MLVQRRKNHWTPSSFAAGQISDRIIKTELNRAPAWAPGYNKWMGNVLTLIKSLLFVHTSLLPIGWFSELLRSALPELVTALAKRREDDQTGLSRGSKTLNKVSEGEPAEVSLLVQPARTWSTNLRTLRVSRCPPDCKHTAGPVHLPRPGAREWARERM